MKKKRFLSGIKTQDLKVTWGGRYQQPKKQLNVQYIGIFEEIDSFIDQKCTSWKRAKTFR